VARQHERIKWLDNMSDGGPNGKDEEMGDPVEHVLREGLRVAPPSPEALARIRAATVADPFGNLVGLIENPHFVAA